MIKIILGLILYVHSNLFVAPILSLDNATTVVQSQVLVGCCPIKTKLFNKIAFSSMLVLDYSCNEVYYYQHFVLNQGKKNIYKFKL